MTQHSSLLALPRCCYAVLLSIALAPGLIRAEARPASPLLRIEYEGMLDYEAHFLHPGDTHRYHSRQVYSTDGRGGVRFDWTTWEDGDVNPMPETFLIVGDRTFHRGGPDQPWLEYSGQRARKGRLQASAGLPAVLASGSFAGPGERESWKKAHGRLVRYARRQPHPRLGDVRDVVEYTYSGVDHVPQTIDVTLYSRDENWRLVARRVSYSSESVAESVFELPVGAAPAPPNEEDETLGDVPPLVLLAPGIWSVDLADIDSRTLVAEFTDYVAVMEIAISSANGERVVDAIRRQWPAKPIRYAFFSHYHPSYTGGLRALIAEGATVVTTPGNADFVRGVAKYPFRMQPDRLARKPRAVRVVTFTDRYELADSTNQLVAINYGARSQHTDEFAVFWFPRQKLLFETEQGWLRADGELRAGRRAKALLSWLAEQGLDVETFVQSYPMRGNAASLTRAQLEALVQARK